MFLGRKILFILFISRVGLKKILVFRGFSLYVYNIISYFDILYFL